jgi:hypothetical protein
MTIPPAEPLIVATVGSCVVIDVDRSARPWDVAIIMSARASTPPGPSSPATSILVGAPRIDEAKEMG